MEIDYDRMHRDVLDGIGLLNEEGPDDWRARIDLSTLDVDNAFWCVLGQVYGYYEDGLSELGLNYTTAPDFGFSLDHGTDDEWYALTQIWVGELSK